MNTWIPIVIVVTAGVGFILRAYLYEKAYLLNIRKREALTDDEIYQRFYASSGLDKAVVIDVWHEIAHILRIPSGCLRSTDKFGKDVGVSWWVTSDDLDVLAFEARHRANRHGLTIKLETIKSVDDYVRNLAAKTKY